MSRSIKFRAFQDEKMLVQPISGVYGSAAFLNLLYEDACLMQYIGLRDKHGVEIYEGDIDIDGRVFTYIVEMGGYFLMKNGEGVQWHEQSVKKWRLPFEIIGSIYENPELIKDD